MRRTERIGWGILGLVGIAAGIQLDRLYQAAEQQHASYNYQPAEKPGFRINSTTNAPTPDYKPSCNNPRDAEDADLCGQWAAVDQVTESNRLNSVNLRVLILTLFLTIIGTGALVWTLLDTRRTSRAELRAYLFVEGVVIGEGTHHAERPRALLGILGSALGVKNSGTTPAHQVVHWSAVDIAMFDQQEGLRAPARLDVAYSSTVPPDGTISADRRMAEQPSDEMIAAIKEGRAAAFVYGAIEYKDVFDVDHRTNYRLYFSGAWPPPLNPILRFTNSGNEAT